MSFGLATPLIFSRDGVFNGTFITPSFHSPRRAALCSALRLCACVNAHFRRSALFSALLWPTTVIELKKIWSEHWRLTPTRADESSPSCECDCCGSSQVREREKRKRRGLCSHSLAQGTGREESGEVWLYFRKVEADNAHCQSISQLRTSSILSDAVFNPSALSASTSSDSASLSFICAK